jgi:gliding motility-associated-like protein
MVNYFRYLLLFFLGLVLNASVLAQTAMPDNTCVGALKHYNVDLNIIPGSTYTWRINGLVQSSSTSNAIDITWNFEGTYQLDVQELTADGCLGPLRSGEVFVNRAPIVIASSNSPVCEDSTINLTVQSTFGTTYLWNGPDNYVSTEQYPQLFSASNINAGDYFVTVSVDGCTSVPSYTSVIIKNCFDFFIPEGFSPNSDGINDLFVIRGIDYYPKNTFQIFNRWGNKVFEMTSYKNTWNGSSTLGVRVLGNELPVGTYFYVLDLGDNSPVYKGTIYLNR